MRVFAFCDAVDMRKGFEGLLALAQRAKVLFFDGTGLCLFHKRLEQGRFACLWRAPHEATLGLSTTELMLFLEGCALVGKQPLSPAPLPASALRTRPKIPAC